MTDCRHCGAAGARMDAPWWTGTEWVRGGCCSGSFNDAGEWSGPTACEVAQHASEKAGKAATRRPRQPRRKVAYGDYAVMCALVNGQRRR